MSSITAGLSGRYATALYQLATEVKQVEDILLDLNSFNELIDNNADLQTLIYSPVFRADEKAAAVGHLLKKQRLML